MTETTIEKLAEFIRRLLNNSRARLPFVFFDFSRQKRHKEHSTAQIPATIITAFDLIAFVRLVPILDGINNIESQ